MAFNVPAGAIKAYAGSTTAPTDFLAADGSNVSRSTYAALFTALSTTFGVGDGSTTFGLPNAKGKLLVCKAASGTFGSMAATGGAKTVNLQHSHTANNHTHTGSGTTSGGSGANTLGKDNGGTMPTSGHTHTYSFTTGNQSNTGSDNQLSTTQSILNPYITFLRCIDTVGHAKDITGMIAWHTVATVETGYLLANGQAVSRSTYATLFSLIGTTYGAGDGSTTFNVPDLGTRVIFGYDSGDTSFDALGETGGAKTVNLQHSHTMNNHTHTWSFTTAGNSGTVTSDISPQDTTGAANGHTHTQGSTVTTGTQSNTGTDSQLSTTQSVLMKTLTLYPLIKINDTDYPFIGEIVEYGGTSAPDNFILCDGSNVSRSTYATLFAKIGTTFGAGDGSTTFGLPNPLGRAISGWKSADADMGTIGNTPGADTISLSHSHTQNSHTHSFSGTTAGPGSTMANDLGSTDSVANNSHTHTYSGTTSAASNSGTDSQLSATQSVANPFLVTQMIIRHTLSTTNIKTINGLAYASVKTRNGLALSSMKTLNDLA